jgi:parvulin-like peptidyl-prolyl isomerase
VKREIRRIPRLAAYYSKLAFLAGGAMAALPSPLPAQESTPASGAEIPADSVEIVDRIAAVVGDTVILYTEILESLLQARAQGADVPTPGTPAFDSVAHETVEGLVDQLVLLQKAKQAEIRVPPEMLDGETDRRFREIRNGFPNAAAFQEAVQSSGRTLVQYRQFLRSQVRAQIMIDQFVRQNSENLPPVVVSEEDIQAWYEENLAGQTRPASIGFEQLVIEPKPSQEARDSALAKAERAAAELREGEDFAVVARRYSDDLSNREQGGDLGWVRRSQLVPAFAQAAWAARTGTPIGPVYTRFGYHIIKVENVRGGERKISHILIRPELRPADTEIARERAVAVADSIRDGIPLAELAERHGVEEIPVRVPEIPFDELEERLGPEYGAALADPIPGDVIGPFDNANLIPDRPAFVIVRITEFKQQGDWEIDEIRDQVRERLTFDEGYRRFVDELRSEVYVDVRI